MSQHDEAYWETHEPSPDDPLPAENFVDAEEQAYALEHADAEQFTGDDQEGEEETPAEEDRVAEAAPEADDSETGEDYPEDIE